ncbi:MAG: hypothetical protein MJ200_02715 [Mycoplasmoidaceae bacterium]|nr:hypothetical protein [Mycoplasmoidaceae bacterium]
MQSQETIEITKVVNDRDASPVTFNFIQHDIVDDTTLPVTIIANATEDQIDEANPEHFTIHYKIIYAGQEEVKDGTISGFSIQLRKQ